MTTTTDRAMPREPALLEARRFPALDGARALAAFAVIYTHVGFISGRSLHSDLLGPILSRGDFGVTVFFLLSGFLLYRPFALHSITGAPDPRVGRFIWRRALRILPALWICVVITLSLVTVYRVRASDYLQYLLLIQTYDHHDYDPNLTQLWTLAVEVSFYLLLPVLARLVGTPRDPDTALRRHAWLFGAMTITALTANFLQNTYLAGSQALLWLPVYLDWFALGMGLSVLTCVPAGVTVFASLRRTLTTWADNTGTCWLIAAVLYLIDTLPVAIPRNLAPATFGQWTTGHYLYGASAFFLLLPLILGRPGRLHRALGSAPATLLGNLSYSVYLWHVPMMLLIQRKLGFAEFKGHFWTILTLTTLASLSIATVSWFVVERPVLRYGSRPWRPDRRSDPNAAASTAMTHST